MMRRAFLALGFALLLPALAAAQNPPQDPPCVDLNTADHATLQFIIHIGPERATQIIEARQVRPFVSVEELEPRIDGIGPARMEDILEQGIACVSPTPVQLNGQVRPGSKRGRTSGGKGSERVTALAAG